MRQGPYDSVERPQSGARVVIILNGDQLDVPSAITVSDLLHRLNIDPHRVAVERNLVVLKRAAFDTTFIAEGDEIEVVNFVGGGERRGQEK
jgi:thiamine biosynthesis protein ThiS